MTMAKIKLVLAFESRLLREMWMRVLKKESSIDVVHQFNTPDLLKISAECNDQDWVVISSKMYASLNDWLNGHFKNNPGLNFFVVTGNGSRITLKSLNQQDQEYPDLTLDNVLEILKEHQ